MSNEMKEIDWSKSPEGATHFDTRGNCCSIGFMKPGVRRGEWEYFGMDGHWILYGPVDSAMEAAMIKRPADTPWTGDGLPPVGAVCECQDESFKWKPGTIVYVGQGDGAMVAVMQADSGILIGEKGEFRPLRTPEAIAAEERSKAISQIIHAIGWSFSMPGAADAAARIYDAGWRLVTP